LGLDLHAFGASAHSNREGKAKGLENLPHPKFNKKIELKVESSEPPSTQRAHFAASFLPKAFAH
jgi:hypothetical protein